MDLNDILGALLSSSPDTRFLELIRRIGLNPFVDLRGADLCGLDLSYEDLSEADLQRADLAGTNLRGCNLRNTKFAGATISGADLSDAKFSIDALARADWGDGVWFYGKLARSVTDLESLRWHTTRSPAARKNHGAPGLGMSIHIGLNHVDEIHYGRRFPTAGCIGDARAMLDLASSAGFEPRLITAHNATASVVLNAIAHARPYIEDDGLLLITFSGHGGRIPNRESLRGWDATWCLYDRQLVTRELYAALAEFPKGARILIVSDSSFAGGMTWSPPSNHTSASRLPLEFASVSGITDDTIPRRWSDVDWKDEGQEPLRIRGLSDKTMKGIYDRHQDEYDAIQTWAPPSPSGDIEADILLLAGAADNEAAADGEVHGAFTAALLQVWNGGAFKGDYVKLHSELYSHLRSKQHPALIALRPPSFARTRAFSI